MNPTTLLNPATWAAWTFGAVQLGDVRRTRRVVALATSLLRRPDASLPEQLRSPSALKAAYRLCDSPAVSFTALSTPHWTQTRQVARQHSLVLLVQDTTEIDHTHHPKTTGLASIGNGGGQGYLLHTVLAVLPTPRQVLGIAYQEPFLRQSAPKGQSSIQRRARERESQVWSRAATAVGAPPSTSRWVHVGDRYSDIFAFMSACRAQQTHFLIRAAQERRVRYTPPDSDTAEVTYLLTLARRQPELDRQSLEIPAQHGRPARTTEVALSIQPAQVLAPQPHSAELPLAVWVIRIWEVTPPPDGEPLEWVLVTSVPTANVAAGWERRDWYCCRWLSEDYHRCLKTGCRLEARHLQRRERLERLLGVLAVIAMRLLQLREAARVNPNGPAAAVVPAKVVAVVAALAHSESGNLTVGRFWQEVARQGGYLGRKHDGPPGWQTLWRGWWYIQAVLDGLHLARAAP